MQRQRKHQFNTIGRMSIVSSEDNERFYLKLLLYKIKGATSFKNLSTVNKTLYKIYKEAAVALRPAHVHYE